MCRIVYHRSLRAFCNVAGCLSIVLADDCHRYKGENSPTLTERAKQFDYYRTHNRRLHDLEMIRSLYTRDKTGTADPAVGEAPAEVELKFGNQVPTGTYLDITANLPLVDPAKSALPRADAPRGI